MIRPWMVANWYLQNESRILPSHRDREIRVLLFLMFTCQGGDSQVFEKDSRILKLARAEGIFASQRNNL